MQQALELERRLEPELEPRLEQPLTLRLVLRLVRRLELQPVLLLAPRRALRLANGLAL